MLKNVLIDVYNNVYDIPSMKENCLKKASVYTVDHAVEILKKHFV